MSCVIGSHSFRCWRALGLAAVFALVGCNTAHEPEQDPEKPSPTKGVATEETAGQEQDRIGGGLGDAAQEQGENAAPRKPPREEEPAEEPAAAPAETSPTAVEGDSAEETDDEVQAALDEATRSSMLIDSFNLKLEIDDSSLRVLDVRPQEEYKQGHIGGAAWVDLAGWKAKALSEGGLTDVAWWGQALGELGIENATRVVVYGQAKDSARAWWLLSYLGVNHVAVLDGGIESWQRAAEPLVTAEPNLETFEFTPTLRGGRLVQTDELMQSLGEEGVLVLDTRSAEEFTTGHVPGALRVEWSEMLNDDGTFKSPAELRALFAAAGFTPENSVVSYCQSGGRASVGIFALELAGYGQARNYFCSWQEWSRTEEAPVEAEEPVETEE